MRALSLLIAATLGAVATPSVVHACACCSEPGQRLEQLAPLDSGLRDTLAQLEFAAIALLYADAGFPDSVSGVVDPASDGYRFQIRQTDRRIVFLLTSPAGKTGHISLALPLNVMRLEVDPRVFDSLSAGGGPMLYKEWWLEDEVSLDGIFAAADKRGHAKLILHGGGNSCTSAVDFTHWTLEVKSANTRFTLLGRLVTANDKTAPKP